MNRSATALDIAIDDLRYDLLQRLYAEEGYCGPRPLDKKRTGAEYCMQYLKKLLTLENFCINMIEIGLHEDVKHLSIANLLPMDISEKYIGYDEVD